MPCQGKRPPHGCPVGSNRGKTPAHKYLMVLRTGPHA